MQHGRQEQGQQRGGSITRVDASGGGLAKYQGSFDGARAGQVLAEAAEHFHLVSPATAVGTIPDATAVALSIVQIDTKEMKNGGEVYNVGGRFGLAKSALDKIASAAGISWDPAQSRRMDDGSDPRYCHYKAVGTYVHFDGSRRTIIGEKELDLRDGSPMVEKIFSDSREETKALGQLRDMRAFIMAHAETKARLRAVRSLGIKTGYTAEELQRPFAVARLMFTGRSEDPRLREIGFQGVMASMLGGTAALYGGAPPAPPAAPAPSGYPAQPMLAQHHGAGALPQAHRPPPVGSVRDDDDRGSDPPAPRASATARPGDPKKIRVPGKDKPVIADAEDKDLTFWLDRMTSDRDAGKWSGQYAEKNAVQLATLQAEWDRRHPPAAAPAPAAAAGAAPREDDGSVSPDQEPPAGDYGRGDNPDNY